MAETVTINDFDIRFEIYGEGTPIVYTPGGFWTLERGRAVAQRLKDLGYKILLWDRPNTGESGLLFDGDNLLRIWADNLQELLHYTGFSPAFVSGGSGGMITSLYLTYIYPSEVRGMILIGPPTDDSEIVSNIERSTFLEPAEIAEKEGMAAVIATEGGFFNWPDQVQRVPNKKDQLLSMNPSAFAQTMRTWARSMIREGCVHFAGLNDEELASIEVPAIVFSGPGGSHPRHTAEALHQKLTKSEIIISEEYYASTLDEVLRTSEEKGGEYFDASLAERIDEFIRSLV